MLIILTPNIKKVNSLMSFKSCFVYIFNFFDIISNIS